MKISMIAAMSKDRVIGVDQQLPWHLPADLQYFKKMTLGKPIVMGRKTWQSLPGILPGRRHVVMTRDETFQADGIDIVHSIEQLKALLKTEDEIMITGGGELYRLFLPLADVIYLTEVDTRIQGDTHFPALDDKEWGLTSESVYPADEKNTLKHRYLQYTRR